MKYFFFILLPDSEVLKRQWHTGKIPFFFFFPGTFLLPFSKTWDTAPVLQANTHKENCKAQVPSACLRQACAQPGRPPTQSNWVAVAAIATLKIFWSTASFNRLLKHYWYIFMVLNFFILTEWFKRKAKKVLNFFVANSNQFNLINSFSVIMKS